jgi:hypothetical protein
MVEAPGIEPGSPPFEIARLYSRSAHGQARFSALTHPGRGQRRGQTPAEV